MLGIQAGLGRIHGQISCGRFNMVNQRGQTMTMTKRNVVLRWLFSSTPFSDFQGMVELWRGSLDASIQHPSIAPVSCLIEWKNDVLHPSMCRIVAVGFLRKHTVAAIELSSTMGKVFNKGSNTFTPTLSIPAGW